MIESEQMQRHLANPQFKDMLKLIQRLLQSVD